MAQRPNFGEDSGRFQKSNYSQLYEFCRRGAANVWVPKPPSGSASLSDPVALETEEQRPEREQNERGVLEALETTSVTPECPSRMCLRLLT